jgi:hypothetical protein
MGIVNFVTEAFDIFVRSFTGGLEVVAFAVFFFLILTVVFSIYFALLRKGIKPFLIFWGIILIGNIFLGVYGAGNDSCSGSWESMGDCLSGVIASGFAMCLFWLEFVPFITFLLFRIFKPSSFLKTLVISLVSSFVITCGLWGVVLITEKIEDGVVDDVEDSSAPAPVIAGIKGEEVLEGEKVEDKEESEDAEEVGEPEVKKLTQTEEIALIEKYYGFVEDGKLEDAYAMKFEPKESFKTFKGWYGNVTSANSHDFTKTGESRYQFLVDLKEEAGDGRYQVIMEIVEGKLLKTVSSKELSSSVGALEEKIYNSSMKAYVKSLGENSREIHLVRNDVDVLVYSIVDENFASIESLNFSNSGRYLMYRVIYGDAWNSIAVYDTVELKKVHEVFAPQYVGFTSDEKNFYECEGMGMLSGYIKIYNVPGFGLRSDLTPNGETQLAVEGTCVYDPSNNTLKYKIMNLEEGTNIDHVYAF